MTAGIIALAGNPNAGKSTLFNALTGSHQQVGNWPGKTVEKKEGVLRLPQRQITLVDLPGTYSLNAYSAEEQITRDFILHEQPEAVVAVVDSANLERNLYLVLQLLEIGIPLILALNMSDVAESRGIHIDTQKLSEKMGGVPIVRTSGARQTGLKELTHTLEHRHFAPCPLVVPFAPVMENEICRLMALIEQESALTENYHPRWLAVHLLEGAADIQAKMAAYPTLLHAAAEAAQRIEAMSGDDAEILVAEGRYELIARWVEAVVHRPENSLLTRSDKLDQLLTHRIWGLPIFLVLMWLVFQITANVSAPLLDWVDAVVSGPLTHWVSTILDEAGLAETWLAGLLLDGVLVGVGGVLVFVPVLVSLYVAIAILEDSGYMARAAFVMDRTMHTFGLQGKSFLPLLVGFGCSVPAVYATRTLDNERDRKITGFLTTFMSCGARLPVYVLFGAVFFGGSGTFIFAMYLVGIGVAILTSFWLTRFLYKDSPRTPFVMELPAYRTPNLRVVWRSTWERTTDFIRNAGTVIFVSSVVIWFLLALPTQPGEKFNATAPENSLFGTVSKGIAPVFAPAGFGEWQASGSLISGFVAKEVVITSMSQLYVGETPTPEATPTFREDMKFIFSSLGDALILTAQEVINIVPRTVNLLPFVDLPEANFLHQTETNGEDDLQTVLADVFTPLSAVAFNVFILLYVPCMSAVAAMQHEFGWRWTLAQAGYTLVVAWVAAVLVYQIGSGLGG